MTPVIRTATALVLLFAVLLLSSCINISVGSTETQSPTETNTTGTADTAAATQVPTAVVTQAPTEPPTTLPTEPPTEAPTGYAAAASWTTEEILAELAAAVNRVKTTATLFTAKLEKDRTIVLDACSVENLQKTAEGLLNKLAESKHTSYAFTEGRTQVGGNLITAVDAIAPEGASFAVPTQAVASARATFDGENLIIMLTLQPDSASGSNPKPALIGNCIDYYRFGTRKIDPIQINNASLLYSNGTIAAGIDGEGRLITITSKLDMTGTGSASMGRLSAEASFHGTLNETWVFTWANTGGRSEADSTAAASTTATP